MLLSEPQGGPGDECIGNHCNGIHTYPMECIRNGMQWYPMHWIPLGTSPWRGGVPGKAQRGQFSLQSG